MCLEPHCTVLGQGEQWPQLCPSSCSPHWGSCTFIFFSHTSLPCEGEFKYWQILLPQEADIFVVICIFFQRISDFCLSPEIKVLQSAISSGSLEIIYWNAVSSPWFLVDKLCSANNFVMVLLKYILEFSSPTCSKLEEFLSRIPLKLKTVVSTSPSAHSY